MENIKEGYTRVSTILAQWNHLATIPKHILDNKCRIGTNVHAKIAAESDGIFLELQEDEKGYFESWRKWYDDLPKGVTIQDVETRLYCDDWKITGCVDGFMYDDRTGETFVLDYKTSASANKKMWALQASFYQYLSKGGDWDCDDTAFFVHLKKDGKKAKLVSIPLTIEIYNTAKCALQTYRYFNA